MNCPTCGEPVEVYSADEGTHSYESVAMKRIKEQDDRIAEAIDYLAQQLCDIEHAHILEAVTKILEGK